jgi:hypothetical protein
MSLVEHADRELSIAGYYDERPGDESFIEAVADNVTELLEVFAKQGHSGSSAPIVIDLFKKLAHYELLTPLTGAEEEWRDVGEGLQQNIRCSRVFKEGDEVYDVEGRVFREPDGMCYTNGGSRVPVAFPYMPHIEYVDVEPEDR